MSENSRQEVDPRRERREREERDTESEGDTAALVSCLFRVEEGDREEGREREERERDWTRNSGNQRKPAPNIVELPTSA